MQHRMYSCLVDEHVDKLTSPSLEALIMVHACCCSRRQPAQQQARSAGPRAGVCSHPSRDSTAELARQAACSSGSSEGSCAAKLPRIALTGWSCAGA